MNTEITQILEGVKDGRITVEDALLKIKKQPFEDIDFAKIDLHRKVRQGTAEVIYGASKTAQQIAGIVIKMVENGQETIIITRLSEEAAEYVAREVEAAECIWREAKSDSKDEGTASQGAAFHYFSEARIGIVGDFPRPDGIGRIVIATGGTSDIPVAEEAAVTAEALGNEVVRLYDVGVAGLHRLMGNLDDIMGAQVIIAIAGMEGALASVIGGLADCPVIAVPTSVGYGASFGGLSALLSMLNSCASGVSVVNIDNGFGAGYLASMINHKAAK